MRILLIGGGGREHALAWKISQSKNCEALFVLPGNPGIASLATLVPLKPDDFQAIGAFAEQNRIDLLVVGPEVPLVAGIRDYFESLPELQHISIVGPGASGARLEGSKDFSKQFMIRHGIPTAAAKTFGSEEADAALQYVAACQTPIVLKADGLAAGKGVIITSSREEAAETVLDILRNGRFGAAGSRLLVEQFLSGIELSVFVLTDGNGYVLLPEAKDYKRIGDKDTGPNTGGMGAVSPVPFATPEFMEKVRTRIIEPTIKGLREEGIPYRGFIFFGLISVGGDPWVIEYNARMGDPETQVVMMRLDGDLVQLLDATAKGTLNQVQAAIFQHAAITVSMVSAGYPGDYEKGKPISLPETGPAQQIFHAGTRHADQRLVTDGGRVISATATGKTLAEAREEAYRLVSAISWDGVYFRRDIGLDLLNGAGSSTS